MRDEVDDLTEAWARERSDLDLAPVAVFSRISRLARHLDLARRAAFTTHGIESWEFDVLAALRRAGAPYELSPGRLLRETLVGNVRRGADHVARYAWVFCCESATVLFSLLNGVVSDVPGKLTFLLRSLVERFFLIAGELRLC